MQAAPSWQRPHVSLQSCPYVPAPHTAHTPTQHASVTMSTRLLANLSVYTHTPSPHTAHKSPQHVSATTSTRLLANLSIRHPKPTPPRTLHINHPSTCLLQRPHSSLQSYPYVSAPHTKPPQHVSVTTSKRLPETAHSPTRTTLLHLLSTVLTLITVMIYCEMFNRNHYLLRLL